MSEDGVNDWARGPFTSTMLVAARSMLQREFPAASLVEVRAELREGVRLDPGPMESWSEVSWTVQVMNQRGSGASLDEAVVELRKELERMAQVPARAERLAAILREIPDEAFALDDVICAARELLAAERRAAMK